MRLPNKIHSYDESILAKFPIVLNIIERADTPLYSLFSQLKNHFEDVGEFIEVLGCLYALGSLEIAEETRFVRYVDRNKM